MTRNPTTFKSILWRQKAWLTAFPLVLAIGFSIAGATLLADAGAFSREGVRTNATVLDLESRRERVTGGDGGRVTRRHVTYRFALPDGTTQRNRDQVSSSFYDAHDPGDEIAITYLADDPGTAEVEQGNTRRDGLLFAGLALGFAGATGWIGQRYWRRASSMFRAVSRGERRRARITGHVDVTPPKAKDRRRKIRWIDDMQAEGESLAHDAATLSEWQVGDEIVIHVDPVTGARWWIADIQGAG
ncbi:MAG: DUF3592 domain-containing protein [Salinarimonas sp.]|nr:DUF3592 domain-containing protein [Salinarimonas sp.]